MSTIHCLGFGLLTFDRLLVFDQFPQPNQKLTTKLWVEQPGGPVAVGLMTMAALGMRVHWGLPISRNHHTATIQTILVDAGSGERTVLLHDRPASPLHAFESIQSKLPKADWFYIDGRDLAFTQAFKKYARAQGAQLFLDMGSLRPHWQEIVSGCDIVIVSDDVMRQLDASLSPQQMLRILFDRGAKLSGITLGQQGSLFLAEDKYIHIPAMPAQKIVDVTNAGDVFHGAFLAAWIKTNNVEKSAQFASRCAAWVNLLEFRARQADFPLAFI
ncbi:hypothetical protein DCC62_27685 [candidate division KSB1 bacterium]|nr:MAG: hypothetical protein DCC62_27685 [candidate division KSB1 bacterium]